MLNTFIIGLGNPGERYVGTWHNLGFAVIDALAEKLQTPWQNKDRFRGMLAESQPTKTFLLKPQTFMNESGRAVQSFLHFYAKDELQKALAHTYVIYDDLDIVLGEYKIQFGKHPKVHNGVNSIVDTVGTAKFWHVRIGTESRVTPEEKNISGEQYVLMKPKQELQTILGKTVESVVQELIRIMQA